MTKRIVAKEQYFTPVILAERCLSFVNDLFPIADFDLVVEPSAGAGAFYRRLPRHNRVGLDIAPQLADLVTADFLSWLPEQPSGRILTIGNPPFGQRAAIAFEFLEHAAEFSQVIAMILPRSFNKYTFQNRMPGRFHLVDAFDCDTFVTPEGKPVSVSTTFQIWEKRDQVRLKVLPPDSHPHFEMKHAHLSRISPQQLSYLQANYDFAIPQVGSKFQPNDVHRITRGSHWFIRVNVPEARSRFERLDFSFLDNMNTAHKSLSKRDIVRAYSETIPRSAER